MSNLLLFPPKHICLSAEICRVAYYVNLIQYGFSFFSKFTQIFAKFVQRGIDNLFEKVYNDLALDGREKLNPIQCAKFLSFFPFFFLFSFLSSIARSAKTRHMEPPIPPFRQAEYPPRRRCDIQPVFFIQISQKEKNPRLWVLHILVTF